MSEYVLNLVIHTAFKGKKSKFSLTKVTLCVHCDSALPKNNLL